MWKVLVAICILGQPCTLFEEDPIKYYHSESECMEAAEAKSISEQAAIDAEALFDTPDQGQVSNDSAASESVSDE